MTQMSFAGKRITGPEIWGEIDLSVIWGEPSSGGSYLPSINCVNGHIIVGAAYSNTSTYTAIYEKGGDWKQKLVLSNGATTSAHPGGYNAYASVIHSDILLMTTTSLSNHYGMNLRDDGVNRTINGAAALPTIPTSPSSDASAGSGWVAMPNLAPPCQLGFYQFEDSRYLVQPSGLDTTSPTVDRPISPPTAGAITVAGAITGGYLAAGDFDVKIAWVTKRNIYQTGQGITQPSETAATATVASGTTGRIDVTIPTRPSANVIGYVVYVGATGGTLYACGGGSAPLSGTKTHVIRATMAQLDMGNRFLYYYNSSLSLRMGRVVNLENSSPITWGTARACTAGYTGGLWSPFFKDSTIWYGLPMQNTSDAAYKADKFDLGPADGTVSLNQTLTDDGEPALVLDRGAYSVAYSQNLSVRSIPEIMAYAVGTPGESNINGMVSMPGFIQIRSCLNNAVLTNITFPDINPYNSSELNASGMSFFDFEFIDGVLWCYVASIKHRAILRMPVRF